MLMPSFANLSINLHFPVFAWTINPTNARKRGSLFLDGWRCFIPSLRFCLTLLKWIIWEILVGTFQRLWDKFRSGSSPSEVIIMSFVNIFGTDCNCPSTDPPPSNISSLSNSSILIALAAFDKTRSRSSPDYAHAT